MKAGLNTVSVEEHKAGGVRGTQFLAPGLGFLLLAAMLLSLSVGRYPVSMLEVANIVSTSPFQSGGDYGNTPWVVVEIIRMPRILLVTLCGMSLALAGATMQGVFRNPLVGPEIAGVSAGASLGGAGALMAGWSALAVVASAFAGGLIALAFAFALASVAGRASVLALVLSGVIVGGFCGAVVGLLETLADPATKLPTIVYWLLGSFAGASYEKVSIVSGVTLVAGTLLLALRWRINLLSLGEDDAASLGIPVALLRWSLMGLVSLMVAAQVSVSGGVGWVGLIMPHIARMLAGPEHSRLLPVSAMLGGIYLLLMDDFARTATPQEIPIGLLTSAIGTPIFALLFWKNQSRGWVDG